ncbi:MAG: PEP/pyruvate-binding domain-containing protein [Chloroflexi bacterium]|nr:PEP/pyruvate-binding domain-containing protein [Chloroflexota bacterium]
MNILWLGDPQSFDLALVGGKVANLSRLASHHRVPPGFCITTAAYDQTVETLVGTSLHTEITLAYRELTARTGVDDPPVAVRSSAVDEDSSGASFAGQHETYLNVIGDEQVIAAVERCWQSAHSDRAHAYRTQQGLATEHVRIAVLVQQLVTSDASCVVFSANPVTGNRDEVMINASWGLGESIVGGTVTPDTFVVRKSDLAILDSQIAAKQRMTITSPQGTREVDVPRIMRTQPSLNHAQVIEAAQLAIALENEMGYATDVECAFAGGQLYLLQCRPITTL